MDKLKIILSSDVLWVWKRNYNENTILILIYTISNNNGGYIIPPIQWSWLTFARWVRIPNHDAFYNEDISFWKNELENHIKILNDSVDKFEDKTENILNNSSYAPIMIHLRIKC